MKRLLIFAAATLLFVACKPSHKVKAASRSKNGVEIVMQGAPGGPWRAYMFGAACAGKLEIVPPTEAEGPIEVVCK